MSCNSTKGGLSEQWRVAISEKEKETSASAAVQNYIFSVYNVVLNQILHLFTKSYNDYFVGSQNLLVYLYAKINSNLAENGQIFQPLNFFKVNAFCCMQKIYVFFS